MIFHSNMKQVSLIIISLLLLMAGIIFFTKPEKKTVRQLPNIQIDKVDSLEKLVKI